MAREGVGNVARRDHAIQGQIDRPLRVGLRPFGHLVLHRSVRLELLALPLLPFQVLLCVQTVGDLRLNVAARLMRMLDRLSAQLLCLSDEYWALHSARLDGRLLLLPGHADTCELLLQDLMRVRCQTLQVVQAGDALEVTHFRLRAVLYVARLVHDLLIEVVIRELEQNALEVLQGG